MSTQSSQESVAERELEQRLATVGAKDTACLVDFSWK
jgi:hypothetical protein